MVAKLKVDIRPPKLIYAAETYTVLVDVTNTSGAALGDVSVIPQVVPGILFEPEEPENVELQEVLKRKAQLVKEMQTHAIRVYEKRLLKELAWQERAYIYGLRGLAMVVSILMPLLADALRNFTDKAFENVSTFPSWAREAFKIADWDDVERIEAEIISKEDGGSFLRTAFMIDKDKLRKVLDQLKTANEQTPDEQLRSVYTLQPNATMSFPFRTRAPAVFTVKDFTLQFTVSWKEGGGGNVTTSSYGQEVTVRPSVAIIASGLLFGSVVGFVVKQSLMLKEEAWFTYSFWMHLIGCVALALVAGMATIKTPNSKKPITAEDFVGGFLIGALTGMFSDTIIDKLKDLSQSV